MRRITMRNPGPGAPLSAGVGLVLFLALATPAPAQGPPAAKPAGYGSTKPAAAPPLARFVAGDGLIFYAEVAGTEAHADAWKQTAAYKILNETPAGALIEDLLAQVVDRTPFAMAGPIGADVVAGVEHVLRNGAVFALNHDATPGAKAPFHGVVVLKGAARKDARALFGRLVWLAMGRGTKPQAVAKGTRKVVAVPRPSGQRWLWWAEKEDLVFAPGGDADFDAIVATLDGKRRNAVEHPLRVELTSASDGFQPVAAAFADAEAVPDVGQMGQFFAKLREFGVKKFDYRWGFQDAALMSVTRLAAPAPRRGALALFDQPTFGLEGLPPLPKGAGDFVVASADPAKAFDRFLALLKSAKPDLAEKLEAFEEDINKEAHINLRRDFLGHLGPKMALYRAPEEETPARAAASATTAPLPSALRTILEAVPKLPRFALVIEVSDRDRVARSLAELLFAANRRMKASIAEMAAEEKAEEKGPPGGSEGSRKKPKPIVVDFQMVIPEPELTYELKMPASVFQLVGVRPAVALGKSHLILATSRDLAKQALALEGGEPGDRWTPTEEQQAALGRLGEGLIYLQLSDPRGTLPAAIADLPNALSQSLQSAAAPGPAPGDLAAGGGRPKNIDEAAPGLRGRIPGRGAPSSGSRPPQGTPGGGAADAAPAVAIAPLKVDPAKVPSPEAIRPFLFPGHVAVAVDDKEVRITTRAAFPNVGTSSSGASARKLLALLGITPPAMPSPPSASPPPPGAGTPGGAGGPRGASPGGGAQGPRGASPGGRGGRTARPG